MATQAFDYFVISDGVTTCTFQDGLGGRPNWALVDQQWSPAIAHLSTSQLGSRGPYDDVAEALDIMVNGATWNAAKDNLAKLERLMKQAVRWARGENVAVVLAKWAPKGSTVATTAAPFEAVVLAGDVTFQPDWHTDQQTFWTPAHLNFTRRGAWLLANYVVNATGNVANPGPWPITGLASYPELSPCQIKLDGFPAFTTFDVADSKPILILGAQASDIQVVAATSGTATGYTIVSDGANFAVGGSVLRYTPPNTAEHLSLFNSMTGMTSGARRFAFFGAVRSNLITTTYQIRVAALCLVDSTGPIYAIRAYTRLTTLAPANTNPFFVPLGILTLSSDLKAYQVAITASAAAGSLDVNYVVGLAIDNLYARAIQLDQIESFGGYVGNTAASQLIVDPLPLTGLSPSVYRYFPGSLDSEMMGYYGDAWPIQSGANLGAALMAKRSDKLTRWVYSNSADNAAANLALTVSRQNAFLVPE